MRKVILLNLDLSRLCFGVNYYLAEVDLPCLCQLLFRDPFWNRIFFLESFDFDLDLDLDFEDNFDKLDFFERFDFSLLSFDFLDKLFFEFFFFMI